MYPYAECGIGAHQSPVAIDLTTNNPADLTVATSEDLASRLNIQYVSDSTPIFFNSGHAAQVNMPTNYTGKLFVGRDAYPLIQFHFHAPSEHTIQTNQGITQYAGELHFVHTRADGKMVVLGVFLDDTANVSNSAFQEILDNTPTTGGPPNTPTGIRLNPMALLPKDKTKIYTYAGSLTTPPCSEGVNWYVLSEPLKVSSAQITQLQGIYNNSNRYTQSINGRVVKVHQADLILDRR
jgi:carbonic anhydrase